MKIESIDFFYLSMPEIQDIGDGSQDALLVRVRAGEYAGWGECEAAPLVSIASLVCPMSHSACKPVQASVLGQSIDGVDDIRRIGNLVRANSLDLLQADHTLSGIDIALWDLLGHRFGEPVWKLLGYKQSYAKTPYASVLFGDSPKATLQKAKTIRSQGFQAAKFGWGPFGASSVAADEAQLHAAREGLGKDGILLIDAGTVWNSDLAAARLRLRALNDVRATWLEEPFVSGALSEYHALSIHSGTVGLAGGEGCHNFYMAKQMIDLAGLKYVQIDAGRIGGITIAKDVADYAASKGIAYVNHTFTSNLALSASLQPYAGLESHVICEYPTELKSLAVAMTKNHLKRDANGQIRAPDAPGLGITPDLDAIQPYLVDAEIRVASKLLYKTPKLTLQAAETQFGIVESDEFDRAECGRNLHHGEQFIPRLRGMKLDLELNMLAYEAILSELPEIKDMRGSFTLALLNFMAAPFLDAEVDVDDIAGFVSNSRIIDGICQRHLGYADMPEETKVNDIRVLKSVILHAQETSKRLLSQIEAALQTIRGHTCER